MVASAPKQLPLPQLHARRFGARLIPLLSDDALFEHVGVRIAFTGRAGGVSEGAYASLNLGGHVGDDAQMVAQNRACVLEALEADEVPLIAANQVHGTSIVRIDQATPGGLAELRVQTAAGVDALVVEVSQVAALLCFADCVPVIVVSPTGRFAVVHAGWRGAVAGIVGEATRLLAQADREAGAAEGVPAAYNVYIGPHIGPECFETSAKIHQQFVDTFGSEVAFDQQRINLGVAVTTDLLRAGVMPQRIVQAAICTNCSSEDYFSYRAANGVCGRHGALAFRKVG